MLYWPACHTVSFQLPKASRLAAWCAGIKGIWNLRKSSSDRFDTYLVLAVGGETRVRESNADEELDEAEVEGFDGEQQVSFQISSWQRSHVSQIHQLQHRPPCSMLSQPVFKLAVRFSAILLTSQQPLQNVKL